MPTRARETPAEEGFILIEVLVSAVILAIVAGAVLTLITATTRSAASQRNHSTAYALAQEDQARLRTMRIAKLNKLSESRTETIGGATFRIESRGVFVNSKSGTSSCTEANDTADYVEISSTVSSSSLLHPISLQSIVSPSSGSLDPSHGTLAVQVTNAAAPSEPVPGISISLSGAGNYSGTTESIGCANFADIPSGNYKLTATSGAGLITPEGKTTYVKEPVGVPSSGTQQVAIHFDRAGKAKAEFVYKEPGTGTLRPAPVDAMEIYDAESGQAASTFGTPGGSRTASLTDSALYPFKTPYAVYAGSCTANNPVFEGSPPANSVGVGSMQVPPGGEVAQQIRVPALELTVTYNSGIVVGGKVVVTGTTCGTGVKRTYVTNAGGHLSNSSAGATEAGLPYGTYNICASATISGTVRRAESSNVQVKDFTSGTTLNMALGSTSSGECS